MKKIFISIIRIYQQTLSPDQGILQRLGMKQGGTCVFYPTCSEYTIHAIEKYGVVKGIYKGTKRIVRCHPWQKNRIDPLF